MEKETYDKAQRLFKLKENIENNIKGLERFDPNNFDKKLRVRLDGYSFFIPEHLQIILHSLVIAEYKKDLYDIEQKIKSL